MLHSARKYLWDIYDSASFLIEDTRDSSLEEFLEDRRQISSALHHLLIIGESCRILRDRYPKIAAQIPEVSSAVGMRNVIAHEYTAVDYALVWQTVRQNLESLRERALMLYQETE